MGRAGGIFPTHRRHRSCCRSWPSSIAAAARRRHRGLPDRIHPRRPVTRVIRFGTDCLAGIPSIIFGLFGFIFFVTMLGMGWSLLSGGLTLALMILPTIIRTSEEAIKAVPTAYREVSFSLGATRWETVAEGGAAQRAAGHRHRRHARHRPLIGETAAVIFTAGLVAAHAGLGLRLGADHVGALLHPGARGDLRRERLRHRRRADHRRSCWSTWSPTG